MRYQPQDDKTYQAIGCLFAVLWIGAALAGVALVGVGVWALIELVQWVTSQ